MIGIKSKNIPKQPRNEKYSGVGGAGGRVSSGVNSSTGDSNAELKLQLDQYRKEFARIVEDIAKMYISKLDPDVANGLIAFMQGLSVGNFEHGAKGANIDSDGGAEVASLDVRGWSNFDDDATFNGLIEAFSSAYFYGTIIGEDNVYFRESLEVLKNVYLRDALNVDGDASLLGKLVVDGGVVVGGNAEMKGDASVLGSLVADGRGTFKDGLADTKIGIPKWEIAYDAQGNSLLNVDKINVRLEAIFRELIIEKLTSVNGGRIASSAHMVCSKVLVMGVAPSQSYRCFFDRGDKKEVENNFVVGDQAICQVFNGTGLKYYWRLVTSVGSDYITLSMADADGDGVPSVGDEIIQLGNRTNPARQSAIIETAYGGASYVQYNGINSFTLNGREVTKIASDGNKFTGDFVIQSSGVNVANEIAFTKEAIRLAQAWQNNTDALIAEINVNYAGVLLSVGQTNTAVDALSGRVTTAESKIEVNSDEIDLRVTKSEYDVDLFEVNAKITNAQESANSANQKIAAMNDDGVFDVNEKKSVRVEWGKISDINGTYQIALKTANGVGTSSAVLTLKYNLLSAFLDASGIWSSENTTGFNRATLSTKFAEYYAAEQMLWGEISQMRDECNNLLVMTNQGITGWDLITENADSSVKRVAGVGIEIEIVRDPGAWCVLCFDNVDLTQILAGKRYTLGFDVWSNDLGDSFDLRVAVCSKSGGSFIFETAYKTVIGNAVKQHVVCSFVATAAARSAQVVYIVGFGKVGRILRVENMMLVAGEIERAYRPSIADAVEIGLLPTGINIRDKKIKFTQDNATFQTNAGDVIAVFDDSGINADIVNTNQLNVQRVICVDGIGRKISSMNEEGDGCLKYFYSNGKIMLGDAIIYDANGDVDAIETRAYSKDGVLLWTRGIDGSIITTADITCYWENKFGYFLPEYPNAEQLNYLRTANRVAPNQNLSIFHLTELNDELILDQFDNRMCVGTFSNQRPTTSWSWVTGYLFKDDTNYQPSGSPHVPLKERYLLRYENGVRKPNGDVFL